MTKLKELENWFADKNKVMIALSGGVDSALVAFAAFQKLGKSAIAVTADYKTLSQEELETAKTVCSEIGIQQLFLDYNELENEDFTKSKSERSVPTQLEGSVRGADTQTHKLRLFLLHSTTTHSSTALWPSPNHSFSRNEHQHNLKGTLSRPQHSLLCRSLQAESGIGTQC